MRTWSVLYLPIGDPVAPTDGAQAPKYMIQPTLCNTAELKVPSRKGIGLWLTAGEMKEICHIPNGSSSKSPRTFPTTTELGRAFVRGFGFPRRFLNDAIDFAVPRWCKARPWKGSDTKQSLFKPLRLALVD